MSRPPVTQVEGAQEPLPTSPGGPLAKPVGRTPSRSGKKAVSGYFSGDLSRALHLLAVERDTNLQALMGEAFDDLLRKYDKPPLGER